MPTLVLRLTCTFLLARTYICTAELATGVVGPDVVYNANNVISLARGSFASAQ